MTIIFIFFALLLFITITPNAIHALLALILLFINFAVLLFVSETSFLGFAYILVYIGAICVLFLYIILLLHMRSYSLMQRSNALILLGLLFGFLAVFSYINFISDNLYSTTATFNVFLLTDLQLFTSYLFITHQHYMFLGVFLLLLALFLSIFVSTKFLITKTNKKHVS
jgi:NADH:ubiquinone oxidoreductase subunit 6 (subunit J)